MKRRALWWLLLLVPMALGVMRLRFDVEVLNLLPANEPVVDGLRLYQQHFSNARELLVALEGADADDVELAAGAIADRLRVDTNRVAHVAWQPPWMEQPAESAELIAYLWLNQPPTSFASLTNRFAEAGLTNALLNSREALATSLSPDDIAFRGYDPLQLMKLPESFGDTSAVAGSGQELFASADGTFRLLFVEATTPLASYRDCLNWLETIRSEIADTLHEENMIGRVKVHYTGRPAFVAEIAGGMERDIILSAGGTMVIIAGLFWWAHRRWKPLLWLLLMLLIVLGGTLALGGLIIGELNVVSLGFAAILLGLAVDYGLVLYQEARAKPNEDYRAVRRSIAPSIFWAALTTAGAFLILNFSGLPGLGQLGTLVAIGVPLAALVMLFLYLPSVAGSASTDGPLRMAESKSPPANSFPAMTFSILLTGAIVALSAIVTFVSPPRFDHSGDALRPRNSPAYATVDLVKQRLGHEDEPLWVVIQKNSVEEVSRSLSEVRETLARAKSKGLIADFTLPDALWSHPRFQRENRPTASWLVGQLPEVRAAAVGLGFSDNSLILTEHIIDTWRRFSETDTTFWPTNGTSKWTLDKVAVRDGQMFLCAGLIHPVEDMPEELREFVNSWPMEFTRNGILLSGWTLLGESVFDIVMKDLPKVLLPMAALILISLWLAYRRLLEILLSVGVLLFTALILSSIMSFLGWRWNLMNLMAMPLLLGAGVDYTIHMQLALQRHAGDRREVQRSVGRALLLCGGTTCTAFGSLAFSSNAGLASLGLICATGILISTLTAVFLLPLWWQAATRNRKATAPQP